MRINKNTFFFSFTIITLFFSFAFSSCKLKAERKSLSYQFEVIDSMIEESDFKSAIKELKKVQKHAYDSWSFIGIYKRYEQIGEKKQAEKVLKKALRRNSHNQELLAIYSNFLLRDGRIDQAAKKAEALRGTKYGGFFSEAVLKLEKEKVIAQDNQDYYKDTKFFDIYYDAYKSGNSDFWLRNCAIYFLLNGEYEKASILNKGLFGSKDDAYFWAMVFYDARSYHDVIKATSFAKNEIGIQTDNQKIKSHQEDNLLLLKLSGLESDSFVALSEVESAQESREQIIANLFDYENVQDEEEEILKSLTTNSVIYANNENDFDTAYNVLQFIVNKWQFYEEGLSLYSKFAFNSNKEREETSEEKELRNLGLESLEMQKFNNRKRIPIEDATSKIDYALENKKSAYLELVKLDLKYKLDDSISTKQKTSDLWDMLEKNYSQEEKFNPLLIQYAISFLLKTGQYDDAYSLFYRFMVNTYNLDKASDFWIQVHEVLPKLELKIAEFAAYFAARKNLYDEALRFYEFVVYEKGGFQQEGIISPYVSSISCANLADIYFGINKKKEALDLYSKILGRENNAYLRSELYCRMALIQLSMQDKKNALRSVEYASLIYPGNARASLIKAKIK